MQKQKIEHINKESRLAIRCTSEQHEQIKASAETCRMTMSEYILFVTLNKQTVSAIADYRDFIEAISGLRADIARIGNLLKLAINRGCVTPSEIQPLQAIVKSCLQIMKDIIRTFIGVPK